MEETITLKLERGAGEYALAIEEAACGQPEEIQKLLYELCDKLNGKN